MKISEISSTLESSRPVTVFATKVNKPGDIRDLIKHNLKIDAETDAEAVQQAIDMLRKRPQTRMVQQMFSDLDMMVRTMRVPIGSYHSSVLRHFTENFDPEV